MQVLQVSAETCADLWLQFLSAYSLGPSQDKAVHGASWLSGTSAAVQCI